MFSEHKRICMQYYQKEIYGMAGRAHLISKGSTFSAQNLTMPRMSLARIRDSTNANVPTKWLPNGSTGGPVEPLSRLSRWSLWSR